MPLYLSTFQSFGRGGIQENVPRAKKWSARPFQRCCECSKVLRQSWNSMRDPSQFGHTDIHLSFKQGFIAWPVVGPWTNGFSIELTRDRPFAQGSLKQPGFTLCQAAQCAVCRPQNPGWGLSRARVAPPFGWFLKGNQEKANHFGVPPRKFVERPTILEGVPNFGTSNQLVNQPINEPTS